MKELLIVFTIAFGILRFIVPVTGRLNQADVFKDLAHIFVGILFGVAITESVTTYNNSTYPLYRVLWLNKTWWILAIGLTTLEVVAFIIRKAD